MDFTYSRTIRFADTDAAGVVYFANYLSICHEAYEEALLEAGIELNRFFGESGVIIPISRAESDYLRPLRCGDKIEVELSSEQTRESEFVLHYKVFIATPARKLTAKGRTTHVCIDSSTRQRTPLPEKLSAWVKGA